MQFLRGMFFGLILGIGLTWFFLGTEPGRAYLDQAWRAAPDWLHRGSEAAGDAADAARNVSGEDVAQAARDAADAVSAAGTASIQGIANNVFDAAQRAQEFASAAAGNVSVADIAASLEEAANQAGAAAGAAAIRARQAAMAAADRLPDIDALGDTLSGWEAQVAAYEMAQQADDMDAEDAAESERALNETFASRTQAAPSDASTPSGAGFEPHPSFYECPVMHVSNPGRVADDRTLLDYTPWVDTPAGVLIRAPVAEGCLSSGYGTRTIDGKVKTHDGVDYYNRNGGTIYAAGDGTVIKAGPDDAYGNAVIIDHGDGVTGLYAHMVDGSLKVHEGEHVTLGEPIGSMGQTGRAYAVHLHYELKFAGETVDPLETGKRANF